MWKKTLELGLVSFALLVAYTGVASAADVYYRRAVYSAELNRIQIDTKIMGAARTPRGVVTLDFVRRAARVNIMRGFYCPPNAICAQVMPGPLTFDGKIVAVKKGSCGEIRTIARQDLRRADGLATQIEIIDHSRDTCRYLVAVPSTEVIVQTLSPRGERTRSVMQGELLRD